MSFTPPPPSATLRDNIFANSFASPDKTFQCIIYTDITGHFPIVHVDRSSNNSKPMKDSAQRNISEINKQAFREVLATLDWKEIYDENNAQGTVSMCHSIAVKLYNKHFPKRKRKQFIQHVNNGFVRVLRNRLKLRKSFLKSIENWLCGEWDKVQNINSVMVNLQPIILL